MKKKHFIFILTGIFFSLHFAEGQTDAEPRSSQLAAIGKSYGDSIVVRWAPDKASAWILGNKYGYRVERARIGVDTLFEKGNFDQISPDTLRTWSLEEMKSFFGPDNNFAAITAQAVYGESFTPQTTNLGTKGIFDLAMEQENRYSFSLFAADNDPMVATALGLRITDKDIAAGETYLYRITSNIPPDLYRVDTGYAFVSASEIVEIPSPPELEATGLEFAVELQWDARLHLEEFTGYYIEKSNRRGRRWERLNDMPLILTTPEEAYQEAFLYSYTDSLEENYEPYSYRIVGVTPFGELSEPSNVVIASGRDRTPPSPPVDVDAINESQESITITWKKDIIEDDLEGYYIQKATEATGPFEFINQEPLPPEFFQYEDKTNIFNENYYQVVAVDTAGNASTSLAAYAVIIDSIPPAQPRELTGDIDTSGIVTLQWNTGTEPDLMGYRIYFTNQEDHEFTNLTPYPLQDTIYTDTIVIKTLTEEIFYRVVAVDQRFNHSIPSETLTLKKPDIIPPVMPAFNDILVTDTAVYLSWINSTSKDVVTNRLYRKAEGQEEWEIIFESGIDEDIYSYADNNVEPKVTYFYTLDAVDDAGLSSGKCMAVSARVYDSGQRPEISNFTAEYDEEENLISLSWIYPENENMHYIVYRSYNGSSFTVYKSVEGQENSYEDFDLLGEGNYEYAIQAIYGDGGQSSLTNRKRVTVPGN